MDPRIANVVFALGRVRPEGVALLGTAFGVTATKLATAAHVTQHSDTDLVLVGNKVRSLLDYQDTTDSSVQLINLKIVKFDPLHDVAILEPAGAGFGMTFPHTLTSSDDAPPGQSIVTLGFPHADTGRLVLTQQVSSVGARVLLGSGPVKSKHIVLNVQTRPGQSGGPVFLAGQNKICAMIIGSYAPGGGGGISLGGVDPATLHQTTQAVSAEYIRALI